MKKFILTISTALLFVLYIFYERSNSPQTDVLNSPVSTAVINNTPNGGGASGSTPPGQPVTQNAGTSGSQTTQTAPTPAKPVTTVPAPKTTPAPAPAPVPVKVAHIYNDGTFTGDSVDAYYGMVQVEAVISNGKIVDVKFLSYPSDRRNSAQLSAMATPILASEAITAQSANVSIVSGATDTSQAFQQSLASALIKAKS